MEYSQFGTYMLEHIVPFIRHEYMLTVYGVVIWALVWGKPGKRLRAITLGMSGGGAIIAWDDELLHMHNAFFQVDFHEWPFYLYIVAGFLAVFIIKKYIFKDDPDIADLDK